MIKNQIILLLFLLLMPCATLAATVYLKDGGVIECILARQQGSTVYVLLNRYTEIDLANDKVNIRKTFKNRKTIGSLGHHRKKSRHRR